MKVRELIKILETMPKDAPVEHLWDGRTRTSIELVWLSKGGYVVTSDYGMVCYDTNDRPLDAPTGEEDRYWSTPDDPNEPE